jgi:hypothetical protein
MLPASNILAFAAIAASTLAAPAEPIGAELSALRDIARSQGEALWPGFGSAPFGLLLVHGEREVLLCHPSMPAGFSPDGADAATGCDRFVRPRSGLPDALLAAMPLFGPPSTIVMGTPETTGLSPARWRSTVFHEHFHQWQSHLPDYYARVAALDLAGGDETGMWMLNFAFPYDRPEVGAAHAAAAAALLAAIESRGTDAFGARLADYAERRRAFAAAAGERNWRYLDFQLWQEGVARWTEIALGRGSSDAAMRAEAVAREAEALAELRRPDLARQQRLAAYPMGAGEAMLLEACGPGWRARYPSLLAMGPLIEDAMRECGDGR